MLLSNLANNITFLIACQVVYIDWSMKEEGKYLEMYLNTL